MNFSRRVFLKSSGLALVSFGFAPRFLERALAETTKRGAKILVVIFQRGAADGLSMVPPTGDAQYHAMRTTTALRPPEKGAGSALRLDGTFSLHPALEALYPFWSEGTMAIVHAVGSPKPTRSHFDAQDFLEAGTPGRRAGDGWLNRALLSSPDVHASEFRAVALQPNLPRSLLGAAPALAISSWADFRLRSGWSAAATERGFESMYSAAVDSALRHNGQEIFRTLRQVQNANLEQMPAQNGARYPNSPFGKRLADIARLIHADLGMEIAATHCGGWDTHVNQGNEQGQLAARLRDFGDSIAAFATDLREKMDDLCVITMTEFGRTVKENGNRGTDHGTGSVMLALGGGVQGGRIYGRWTELKPSNLFEGRDVPVTKDYRTVLGEVLGGLFKLERTDKVFPGFEPRATPSLRMFT